MRILVATDGSKHAGTAVRLVAGMEWPSGSNIVLVRVATDGASHEDYDELEGDARILGSNGRTVERLVVRSDDPAKAILGVASDRRSDVIAVGHRGHGAIASLLLGSVAAEVTENATMPVLIARGDRLGPIVLADDGSEPARAARAVVADWPALRSRPVHVVSVAQVASPVLIGVAPSMRGMVAADIAHDQAEALSRGTAIARETAAQLRSSGVATRTSVMLGDPADAVLQAAAADQAALIVVGSRGLHGISGVLGSVGRSVTLRATCSVLVVHAT